MGDSFDRAQRINEFFHQLALDQIDPKLEIQPTGQCLCCGEPVKQDQRWCHSDCRNEWQYWQDRQ